jgi:hypothetical protein
MLQRLKVFPHRKIVVVQSCPVQTFSKCHVRLSRCYMKDLLSHLAIAATTVVAVLFSFGLPRSVSSFAPHYPSRRPKTAMIPKYP